MRVKPIIPAAQIARIRGHVVALGSAVTPDDALAALFLLHCACKDCLDLIPAGPKEDASGKSK